MTEKVLNTIELSAGNGRHGQFEYEIHEVVNEGVKQFRLRLWDYRDRLRVRFAMNLDDLKPVIEQLLEESK